MDLRSGAHDNLELTQACCGSIGAARYSEMRMRIELAVGQDRLRLTAGAEVGLTLPRRADAAMSGTDQFQKIKRS